MTCEHKNMVNMDHKSVTDFGIDSIINRHCVQCGFHIYGVDGSQRSYSKSEWDALMNSVEGEQRELFV